MTCAMVTLEMYYINVTRDSKSIVIYRLPGIFDPNIAGADLGGPRGPVSPSKICYLYVTATINSRKLHSMMFNHY